MLYTVDIKVENKSGVLYRITGLLAKRKINIERINVYVIKNTGFSNIFFTADIEDRIISTIVKQIDRIIEVVEIKYHPIKNLKKIL
ncbi:MAG: ACT domain-containing protein [Patescibacteria group bacterium]